MIIRNIQALRALAANAVVISHLVFIERKYGQGLSILPTGSHALIGGVDLFFVISGFIMVTIEQGISWRRFLADRITRIYPAYWVYTALVLAVFLLTPDMVNTSYPHPPSLVRSILLIPDSVPPLLAVGWTLIHEMYFYLCFALILFLAGKFKTGLMPWLAIWAALVVVLHGLVTVYGLHSPFADVVTHPLTLEFIAGAIVGFVIQRKICCLAIPAIASGVLALIVGHLLTTDMQALTDVRDWRHVLMIGLPCALIVYGAVAIELRGEVFQAPSLPVALGNASYSTYLSHVLVLSALGRMFVVLPWHNLYSETAFLAACLVIANIWGIVSYRRVEQPVQRWARSKLHRADT